MTAFVRANNTWNIQSLNKGVVVSGEWGDPPDARILRIGERRVGIELRDAFQCAGEASVYVSILVPWKGEVREALSTEIGDDDHGTCGDGDLPCYRNGRKITFVKGADPEYNDIIVTLSGTAQEEGEAPPWLLRSMKLSTDTSLKAITSSRHTSLRGVSNARQVARSEAGS